MIARFWSLALALALFAGLSRAQDAASYEAELAAAKQAVVSQLEGFVEWCGTVKLYLERDKAYEAILRMAPQHEAAHRGLKHSRQRDGTWLVPEKRPESKNYGAAQLKECLKRRKEIAGAFRARVLELCDAHSIAPDARKALYPDILSVDPDDPDSRALLGEVRRDDEWVLVESANSKARRAELRALAKELIAGVAAPAPSEVRAKEKALEVTWTAMIATPRVRVLSSGSLDEARNVAVMCTAAADLFRRVTGAKQDLPDGLDIYLLTTPVARDSFIERWPGWSTEDRVRLKTWAGTGLPGEIHHARWDADAPRRLDGAVRHVFGLLTLINYGFDHQKCAWAWEGFGLYLTRELVGTHYTWYSTGPSSGDAESKELLGKLMMGDANWVNEAYQRAKRGKAPKLEALVKRRIDQFGVDDVLASHALAAYLLEGRADKVGAVLQAIGSKGSETGLSAALGEDLAELDARLLRFLSERK